MRPSFKARFFALVGLQLLLLVGLIAYKQVTLLTGERVLLKTIPVDPLDMFRGDYVVLSYEISNLERWKWQETSYRRGETVFVKLTRQGRFWDAESVSKSLPPSGELFMKGRVRRMTNNSLTVEYGIESYFVPEGKGRELEQHAGRGLTVEARVDRHGRALIRNVRLDQQTARR
jgi:uncharacterized membrane-anchored protein